jgi:hypothetical protein
LHNCKFLAGSGRIAESAALRPSVKFSLWDNLFRAGLFVSRATRKPAFGSCASRRSQDKALERESQTLEAPRRFLAAWLLTCFGKVELKPSLNVTGGDNDFKRLPILLLRE